MDIRGIKGRYFPDRFFNEQQLIKGIKIELMNIENKNLAKSVAKDNLLKHKNYYIAFEKMLRARGKGSQ